MRAFLQSRTGLALPGCLAVAAFFLAVDHQAHLLGLLPYGLLLLCPLMHLFMHGGHGAPGSIPSDQEGHADHLGRGLGQAQPPPEGRDERRSARL